VKPERQQLISDLLNGEGRRNATLIAGARVLRRRRQWRVVRRSCLVLACVAGLALGFQKLTPAPQPQQASTPTAKTLPAQQALTDDQLLALFPGTPVALATMPDGSKRLLFPRPGDDQRFLTRL